MATDLNPLRRWISQAATGRNSLRERNLRTRRRARLFESLESRVLCTTTDYKLDGNQLTTYTDGVAGAPVVVPDINNVQITGDATLNHVIIQNFAGHVTVTGNGGADQITFNGANLGGTLTLAGAGAADQLTVRAPAATLANMVVNPTNITMGTDTVNYGASVGAISVVGQLFTTGDTLTINGTGAADAFTVGSNSVQIATKPTVFYSTFTTLTVNGGGGSDTFNVTGDTVPTTLNATGSASFVVANNGVALTLNGGTTGTDTFTINNNAGPIIATGQGADNTFTVNASAASVIFNGGSSINTYAINANGASVTINGGALSNNVTVGANSGSVVVNGGTGIDSFTVNTTGGTVALNGGAGSTSTYNITAPTIGQVTVTGNTGSHALTFHGTIQPDVFAVTSTTLSAGTGSTVNYSALTAVTVDGVAGADTFIMTGSATPTTLQGQAGNDTFNIRANTALTTVNTGGGTNTINVGSNAPGLTNNVLAGVVGGVDVVGNGLDILNIDDAGNATATTATLAITGFTGIGGGVTYAGLATLNVKMGSGGNTLNVTGTPGSSATTGVNLGAGNNSVLVTSTAPTAGGNVDGVLGTLTLTGSGTDDLVIDDAGSATGKTGTLSATAVTGLSAGDINYVGFDALTVDLGTGGNTLTVASTLVTATTNLFTGTGSDTVTIQGAQGVTNVTVNTSGSTINVQAINALTTIDSTLANTTVNVGSTAPTAGGVLAGIQAGLNVLSAGGVTLEIDDSGNSGAATGTMSSTQITGFGMAAAGITFSGVQLLDLFAGTGGNTVTITGTDLMTPTNVHGNSGVDNVTLQNSTGPVSIATAGGDDNVLVQAAGGTVSIDLGTGAADVARISSTTVDATGVTDGLLGNLSVTASGTAALIIGDGGNTVGKSVSVDATSVSGVATGTITYTNMAALTLLLGSGQDTLQIFDTGAPTTAKTGAGDDIVYLVGASHLVNLSTGDGNDIVYLENAGAEVDVDLGIGGGDARVGAFTHHAANLIGLVKVTGATDGSVYRVGVESQDDTTATTATMTGTTITGMNAGGIEYHDVTVVDVQLGSAGDTFEIDGTITGSTSIEGADGDDTFNVTATDGATTIDTGTGTNTVNVGSLAPVSAGSDLSGIAGTLSVSGSGTDVLNIFDAGSTTTKAGTVTSTGVTGLSTGSISYGGLAALNIELGSGINTLTIASTEVGAATTITTGSAANIINVQSTDSALVLNLGAGGNTVNVGSLVPAVNSTLDGLNGGVTIHGGGADAVNLDDSGNSVGKTLSINSGDVSGASPQPVLFDSIATLLVKLGSGVDDVTVTDTAAATTLNTGAGADTVKVYTTTEALTVQTGTVDGDTVTISSVPFSTLAGINGAVTVVGNGADTLDVDDSSDTGAQVGALTSTWLTGFAPATITYSGLAHFDIHTGDAADTLNISSTAAGTAYSVGSSAGADQINVGAISGTSTDVNGILGPITVNGTGAEILSIDDHGAAGGRTGFMDGSNVTLANAVVNYGSLATLNLTFAPATTFGVRGSAAGTNTVITSTSGTVTVGGTGAANLTANVAGPVAIVGGNATDVVIDDSADATGQAAVITSTTVSGLSPAAVTYGGASSLTVLTGNGADQVTVNSTHGNVVIIRTGMGDDHVDVLANSGIVNVFAGGGTNAVVLGSLAPATVGGLTSGLAAPVNVDGTDGSTALTIDDSGDATGQAANIFTTQITGLNVGYINYASLASVLVRLGSGADAVNVQGTGAATAFTVDAGMGDDAVTVAGSELGGTLTLDGADGTDSLIVNGGGTGTVTMTATSISGLPQQVNYANFETLALNLAVGQSLTLSGINPATTTSVSVPSGNGSVDFTGDFNGTLNLSDLTNGSVTIGGDYNGTLELPGNLQGFAVGGDLNGSVHVAGNVGTMTVGDDLTGMVVVGGSLDSLAVGNDLSGSVGVIGNTTTVTIGGDLLAAGSVTVGGHVGTLAIAGADAGSATVGSIDLMTVGGAVPAAGTGTLFSLTQAGAYRTVRVISSDGVAAGGVAGQIAYDGSSGPVPQAAILLANAKPRNRFDVILDAPANSSGFNLTRVKAAGEKYIGVRNVDVTGAILNAGLTAGQAGYFGEVGDHSAGVYLPAENLAAVACTGNMALFAIRAKSIQAVGFASVTEKGRRVWNAAQVQRSKKYQDELLVGTLAVDPTTKKPYAKINKPGERLRVIAGTNRPVGLFMGKTPKLFVGRPSYFSDQHINGDAPVAVEVTYAKKWSPILPVITQLTFRGDGGSIDTDHIVRNITSTGPLGDVTLRAGKLEALQDLEAPSMFGKLKLPNGGKVANNNVAAELAALRK